MRGQTRSARAGRDPGAQGGHEDAAEGVEGEGVVARFRHAFADRGGGDDDPLDNIHDQLGHPRPGGHELTGEGALGLVDTGLYLDLSRVLRNPADDPTMRFCTGLDDDVYAHVLKTPGALTLFNRTAVQLRALAGEVPVGRLARLTVACQGGRHRSVAAAEATGWIVR